MKKILSICLLLTALTLNACTPVRPATSAPQPRSEPSASTETQIINAIPPTEANPTVGHKLYSNTSFGLSFQFQSNWYGPGEYMSDGTLRVEVGSDKVYPYGETPAQPSDVKNSYNVVIQYTKNNQNPYWKDTYQSLQHLKDGESLSDARTQLIRVRQLSIGKLTGFEYISTLSETGKTDHFYIRSVMLVDEQTNDLLTVMGQPINIEVEDGTQWRAVYQTIDEANLIFFHGIVKSIMIK